jgi:hypothetical protein
MALEVSEGAKACDGGGPKSFLGNRFSNSEKPTGENRLLNFGSELDKKNIALPQPRRAPTHEWLICLKMRVSGKAA